MHLTLLPVVVNFLSEESGAAALDEVVEYAENEEGALEGEINEGPVVGGGAFSMLLGVVGWRHSGVGGGRKL